MSVNTIPAPSTGGGVSDGDKGDITVTASGATWTIDNSVVTTTKMGGDVTTAGKALLTAADAAAQRTALALGTAAQSATGDFAAAVHTHAASAIASGTVDTARLGSGTANSTTFLRGDQTWATPAGGSSPVVYVAGGADTAINQLTDVTIVTRDVTSVGTTDKLVVEAHFTILNNSTATRALIFTLDFDGLFDVEFTTGALAFSTTLMHPFFMRAVLDIRSASLAYATFVCEGQLAAGIASGTDTTMAATHLRAMGWGTTTTDVSGTTTVALKARSPSTTATQTFRLHSMTISKYTPT